MSFEKNIENISSSLSYLEDVTQRRLEHHLKKMNSAFVFPEIKMEADDSPLYDFVSRHQMVIEEYLILLLGLLPHIKPNFLDTVIQQYFPGGADFPEIGGAKARNLRNMMPTGETALFILAGNDIYKKIQVSQIFSADHFFAKESILSLEHLDNDEPRMSGRIILHQDYVDLLTLGTTRKPSFGPDFPAKNISTQMDWCDLILNPKTEQQIQDIKVWLDHNEPFMNEWEMGRKVKRGYRTLFYGPPGTGKTLTATLLGKQFNKEVYRIDLSQIVSKYIGETEKNLEKVFNKAEHRDWILFFDEADALFGKRSNVQSANDKYANQEVSYLLQRVEDFSGLIILASNYKSNIDQAFLRRFNSIINFPIPNVTERYQIWKTSVPIKASIDNDIDLKFIASKYELTGSAILNVIHYASLQTIHRKSMMILKKDLMDGIEREYHKEERVFGG